jgi:hypothetical protein
LKDELKEIRRPRMLFDIAPNNKRWTNLYYVTLKNVGGSPAFNISCAFTPDLQYADTTLSKLPIFKNLHHLAQGDEISFFYESATRFLNDPKYTLKSTVKITYEDSSKNRFDEPFEVDLERYRNILYTEEKDIGDLIQQVTRIQRTLERIQRDGLVTKTLAEVKREQKELMKRFKQKGP